MAILILTWRASNTEAKVNVMIHADIQYDLGKIISAAIHEQLPTAGDVRFSHMYTETLSENGVKAYFQYTFTNTQNSETTNNEIQGTALISRDPKNNKQWVLEKIDIDGSTIEFENGLVITKEVPQ